MAKQTSLLVSLLMILGYAAIAQPDDISPNYMLANFSGVVSATHQLNGGDKEKGFGIYSIGIPAWTPSINVKEKFYVGGALGLEIGAGFAPGNVVMLIKIPIGVSAGYQFSDDLFVSARYYYLAHGSTFLQGSGDDGRVYTGTIRYKNYMLDVTTNVKGEKRSGLLHGRMEYDFLQVFPKYLFNWKDRNYWVGIRYESFAGRNNEVGALDRATNLELLFGKIISR